MGSCCCQAQFLLEVHGIITFDQNHSDNVLTVLEFIEKKNPKNSATNKKNSTTNLIKYLDGFMSSGWAVIWGDQIYTRITCGWHTCRVQEILSVSHRCKFTFTLDLGTVLDHVSKFDSSLLVYSSRWTEENWLITQIYFGIFEMKWTVSLFMLIN